VKVLSELDITERRVPQDGRFKALDRGRAVDFRVSIMPNIFGEDAVLRVLDKQSLYESTQQQLSLDSLGFEPDDIRALRRLSHEPYGMLLVTGPTGSGKTTTLYAALSIINRPDLNIMTIEDPVEYQLQGISQTPVSPKIDLTFANGLRSFLRQDPDVIMVGEIRDTESALIGIEAALTGHLVLSSLHTNDAPSSLTRLVEMGIEPFLVASSIECVVAQRLVRMLCTHCKRPQSVSEGVLAEHGLEGAEPFEAAGCSRCGNTGYRGRVGVYEVMTVSERIRALILERASVEEMVAVALAEGMRRLRDDGLQKVREGLTSIAEVERMTNSVL